MIVCLHKEEARYLKMESLKYIPYKTQLYLVIIFILTEMILFKVFQKNVALKFNNFVEDENVTRNNYVVQSVERLANVRYDLNEQLQYDNRDSNNTVNPAMTESKIYKILQWTGTFYSPWQGEKSFEMCEFKNCYATDDKTMYNDSDAVLFHMRFLKEGFPRYRFPSQKWIMHIKESPVTESGKVNYKKYNGIFNTTWTYNRKSDIWTNYSHVGMEGGLFVKKQVNLGKLEYKNYALGKIKTVAWFVSACKRKLRRLQYVKNLQKHIAVDIYGNCGMPMCNKSSSHHCLPMMMHDYKFYLSFENSLCDDYVTEKLWRALRWNVLPIVLGAYNYSQLMPPKSYIDVKDYKSPKELADHLKLLDGNDTLYSEYLQWKDEYDIVPHPPYQCSVCEYLNRAEHVTQTYDRLDLFWNTETDCYNETEFYTNVDASSWQ